VKFPNKWPDARVLPGFQSSVEEYFDKCQDLGLRTMEALEMGFGLPQDALLSRFKSHASQLRLNHYPALPVQRLTDGLTNRLWPHADYGVLTFLVQDSVGGLQIWDNINQSGFLPIPCNSRYEIIVNAGGTLQRWTNDFLKAGLHLVVMPDANQKDGVVPERFSLAFFLHTARTTSAGPLPSFVDKDHPALYDEITTFEFERRRTEQTY
jgi:isopenicillin N synthase-like dioxygenase